METTATRPIALLLPKNTTPGLKQREPNTALIALPTIKFPKRFVRSTSYGSFADMCSKFKQSPTKSCETEADEQIFDEKLRDSICVYSDYQKLVNPPKNYIESLCPISTTTNRRRNKPSMISFPRIEYAEYKLDTMRLFKRSEFRIKKVKISLSAAKRTSIKAYKVL